MRNDYIHITLVIDKSGSMYTSKQDVIGGVQKIIDEQKKNKDGKCTISLYTFNDKVNEVFVGKDVNEIGDFKYDPDGLTALNDGCGVAIFKTGQWLAAMNEDERPSKVMIAVMTDGMENSSKEYTLERVKEMISHQETKYNWTFIYEGVDITTTKMAEDLGFKLKTYSSRAKLAKNYDMINCAATAYRSAVNTGQTLAFASATLDSVLLKETTDNTMDFESEIGTKLSTD